jgi:hypothetical protein
VHPLQKLGDLGTNVVAGGFGRQERRAQRGLAAFAGGLVRPDAPGEPGDIPRDGAAVERERGVFGGGKGFEVVEAVVREDHSEGLLGDVSLAVDRDAPQAEHAGDREGDRVGAVGEDGAVGEARGLALGRGLGVT